MNTRRTFLKYTAGGMAFTLFGFDTLTGISKAIAQIPGGTLGSGSGAEVPDAAADPAGDAAGGHDHAAGRQARRLLRDLDAAVRPADPAGGLPATTVWGYGAVTSAEQAGPAGPQRAVADDRGEVEPAGAGQVDQRAGRRERQLPPAPAAGRPDAALGQPARRHRRAATRGRRSTRRPAPTRARCRSSPTCTAPSASATRATATPRPGTCPRPATSRPATPPRARGTTSSPARRRRSSASRGGRVSPPSSTRTSAARRRSGTTTTRWA